MQIYAALHWVLRTQNQCQRSICHSQQIGGNHSSTRATKIPRSYARFLSLSSTMGYSSQNLSTLNDPLHSVLLQQSYRWNWTQACAQAFEDTNNMLSSSHILVHYDNANYPRRRHHCLWHWYHHSHITPEGNEHPTAFASQILTCSECNYAQLEKEALPFIYSTKVFSICICMEEIPHWSRNISLFSLASAWLQCWALLQSA